MAGVFEANGIFYPVFAHLGLLFFLFVMVTIKRQEAVRLGVSRNNDFAFKSKEPEQARRWVNNLNNQFELPLLFYVLIALLAAKDQISPTFIVLAWIFVFGRFTHTFVQVTGDNVKLRGMVFMINFLALAVMWLYFLYLNLFNPT